MRRRETSFGKARGNQPGDQLANRLFSTASALALGMAIFGATSQSAYAETCVTSVGQTSADAVTSVGDLTTVTGNPALAGFAPALTDVTFTSPPLTPTDSLNVAIAAVDSGLIVNLSQTTAPFVNALPTGVPVLNGVNVQTGSFIATVTPGNSGASDGGNSTNTACGSNANATGGNASAFGANSQATGTGGATAVGEGAQATGINGATAVGQSAEASGEASTAVGQDSTASGVQATASGNFARAEGDQSTAVGANAFAAGLNDSAFGFGATVNAANGVAVGAGSNIGVGASDSVAVGQGASVGDGSTQSVAVGQGSSVAAGVTNSTVIGNQAQGNASNTTAVGQGAQANAAGSAAFGQGAVASLSNQQVFGTSSNTYSTPGITSAQSKSRQSGPLEVVTTDANGNLASDGGEIFKRLDEAELGIAMSIAMQNPDLVAGEKFGVAMNAGFYEGAEAMAISAQGVVGYNVFGDGDRFAVSGGVGVGFGNDRGQEVVGGRVGGQLTWR